MNKINVIRDASAIYVLGGDGEEGGATNSEVKVVRTGLQLPARASHPLDLPEGVRCFSQLTNKLNMFQTNLASLATV